MRRLLIPADAIVIVALAVAVAALSVVLLTQDDGAPAAPAAAAIPEPAVAAPAVPPAAPAVAEPVVEASTEPVTEPTAAPVSEDVAEPIGESRTEPAAAPAAESATGFPAGHITASEAANHVGSRKTVCGQAASATFAANSNGQPTFLNLDRPYPDQLFTIVIWGRNRDSFPEPPEILYRGRAVCVTGLISQYQGQPQVEVALPSQMAIVD